MIVVKAEPVAARRAAASKPEFIAILMMFTLKCFFVALIFLAN